MIIIKCDKEGCKGHLVGWNSQGVPTIIPNREHVPSTVKITPEIREQLNRELNSEPFATYMDVVKEEAKKKRDA